MATVNKDFKIKHGLIVEGASATVNGNQILTEVAGDAYILDLIGGETLITSVESTQMEVIAGELNIKSGVFDPYGEAAAAEINAINAAAIDASTKADAAQAAAEDTAAILAGSAQSAAIAAAQDYTDAEVADEVLARDAAILFAKNAAEDFATSEADAAEAAAVLTANGHTDAQIVIEAARADLYADSVSGNTLSSANTYTDGEITDALSTASGDATIKANNALASANSYTDGEIITALATADGYADAALVSANSHTDDAITALDTLAQGYANTAESNANAYTDNAVAGLDWKNAAHVLYADATPLLSGSSPLTIDGHLFTVAEDGLRVLVTSGNDGGSDAGIYVYSHGATWTLTRSIDADAYTELIGAAIYISEGTQFGGTSWVQNNPYITDFSAQGWTQFSGQGSVTAGSGITVDGLEVSVNRTTVDTWYDAAGDADAAEAAANLYTDGRETVITSAYQTYADLAETDAKNYADGLAVNYDAAGAAASALSSANGYTDSAISTEVTNRNSAIATAKGEATQIAEDYTDSSISTEVTNRNSAIATAKGEAISTAENYADGLMADEIVDRNNAIDNAVNAIDTDDIEEGSTNHYFTDARAKSSAANLLTNATLTNITITGTGAGLTITAENGVGESDTDDLDEGTTNLYFTPQRAVDALEAVVPNFTAVEVNSVAKQVASTLTAATAGIQIGHAFAKADYRSAEFLVKVAYGTHTEISKVLITLDTSDNIAITEYGTIGTNGSASTISAGISGTDVQLLVITANNNSTVTVMGTLLV